MKDIISHGIVFSVVAAALWLPRFTSAATAPDDRDQKRLSISNEFFSAEIFGTASEERVKAGMLEICLRMGHNVCTNYSRGFDSDRALAWVEYEHDGVNYRRECIASSPSRVLVMHLTSSRPGALDFTLLPEMPPAYPFGQPAVDGRKLGCRSRIAGTGGALSVLSEVEDPPLCSACEIRVKPDGAGNGVVNRLGNGGLGVVGATEATVVMSFVSSRNPAAEARRIAAAAARRSWRALSGLHFADIAFANRPADPAREQRLLRDLVQVRERWVDELRSSAATQRLDFVIAQLPDGAFAGRNANWWWNEIGAPQQIGMAALCARPHLTDAERADIVRILKRADGSLFRTGQNRIWLERIRLMRALLTDDVNVAERAIAAIKDEIVISPDEGVKSDGSFHQHGPQQQFGNYGLSFIDCILPLARILKGTCWQFDDAQMDVIRLLMREGYRWVCWKGMMDVSSMGRQLFPGEQANKGRRVARALKLMRELDPAFSDDEPVGFKFYDQSAYAIYRTTNWMASVRLHTPTRQRTETWINSENTRGQVLCDGALFVYATGREYEEIFPLWNDWRKIPGVTSYHIASSEERQPRHFNKSEECRGYEKDGKAVVEWREDKEGLKLFKRWIFSPDGIVAEGSEISSDYGIDVVTTVEQAIAQPDVSIGPYENGALTVVNGGFEYRIEAPREQIYAAVEDRAGDYRDFNPTRPGCKRQGKVLSVYINHGTRPKNASYRYSVMPLAGFRLPRDRR